MVESNEHALERDSELMLISKIFNLSSEDGHEYKFLLVVDTGNKFATAIKKSERTSEKSLELLKNTYMIDINEHPNAIDEVIKRSLTLKDLTQLFPKLVIEPYLMAGGLVFRTKNLQPQR